MSPEEKTALLAALDALHGDIAGMYEHVDEPCEQQHWQCHAAARHSSLFDAALVIHTWEWSP